MSTRLEELKRTASNQCLSVSTYNPGGVKTRYRFHEKPSQYFEGNGLFTALGIREAEVWLDGYCCQ